MKTTKSQDPKRANLARVTKKEGHLAMDAARRVLASLQRRNQFAWRFCGSVS